MKTIVFALLALLSLPLFASTPKASTTQIFTTMKANAAVFRVWSKRIIRSNGQVITPDQPIVVTVPGNPCTPFANGAKEIKAELLRVYGFDYKKVACTPNDFYFKKLS